MNVHESILLHITDEYFYLQPQPVSAASLRPTPSDVLVISRLSGEISGSRSPVAVPNGAQRRTIYGIAGLIQLIAGSYLIVIQRRSMIGLINQQPIYKVEEFDILSFSKSVSHLNELQKSLNDTYLAMVRSVLATPHFYFSYTYDLTHSTQRLNNITSDFLGSPMHERADSRFLWNHFLLERLKPFPHFCIPIMMGFVAINTCRIGSHAFTWTLVSRRSWLRAGPRLQTRGADEAGNVANYVESEQILEYKDNVASFVQTRGSIPLVWTQAPDLMYKPDPQIVGADHESTFQNHMKGETFLYGRQVLVNLIDQKGMERKMEVAMRSLSLKQNKNIKYVAFDFHKECSKMRWHRLSILMDMLEEDVLAVGYFLIKAKLRTKKQVGVFRTNCMDCLDRTNVVQSLLARRNLQLVFEELKIWSNPNSGDPNALFPELFENVFRNVWSDNADVLSTQYAGTGALKTEFTRTGKRTIWGLLQDGVNSAKRYYVNNFQDGQRTDSLDVFLGRYRVESGEGVLFRSPLVLQTRLKIVLLPVVLAVSLAMMFLTLILSEEYNSKTFFSIVFWLLIVVTAGFLILRSGREFVDNPRLGGQLQKPD